MNSTETDAFREASDEGVTSMARNSISMQPQISVIVPCFNSEKYVMQSLVSACNQTLKNIEILVVDDGSTDSTSKIVLDLAKNDPRIRYRKLERNVGEGRIRNICLEMAQGEYVAFLDSDDLYPNENVLEVLFDTAGRNAADVCGGNMFLFNRDDITSEFPGEKHFEFKQAGWMTFHEYPHVGGYQRFIFRRDLLAKNSIRFPQCRRREDPPFLVAALCAAGKFYCISDVIYLYRVKYAPLTWNYERYDGLLTSFSTDFALFKKYECWEHYPREFYDFKMACKEMLRDASLELFQRNALLRRALVIQCEVPFSQCQGVQKIRSIYLKKVFVTGALKHFFQGIMRRCFGGVFFG